MSLPAGSYALNATAIHPWATTGPFASATPLFTPSTSSSFTLAVQNFGVSDSYDAMGNVTSRTINGGALGRGRTQSLQWDALGRLMSVTQTDFEGHAFTWTATYDARNRRVQCVTSWSGGPQAGQTLTERSWHDPSVEFLEVGLEVTWTTNTGAVASHERWWKIHGPNLSGGYGGLQGMGGLEAVVNEATVEAVGLVDDAYGHILGFADAAGGMGSSSNFEWNVSRFGGYGPLPGYWAPSIADGVSVWRTFGWRGKRLDATGYYHLGAREYEPGSGRFLSPDPLGHGSSMGLYDYANGDPINFVDPRGRTANQPSNAPVIASDQNQGWMSSAWNATTGAAKWVGNAAVTTWGFIEGAVTADWNTSSTHYLLPDNTQNVLPGYVAGWNWDKQAVDGLNNYGIRFQNEINGTLADVGHLIDSSGLGELAMSMGPMEGGPIEDLAVWLQSFRSFVPAIQELKVLVQEAEVATQEAEAAAQARLYPIEGLTAEPYNIFGLQSGLKGNGDLSQRTAQLLEAQASGDYSKVAAGVTGYYQPATNSFVFAEGNTRVVSALTLAKDGDTTILDNFLKAASENLSQRPIPQQNAFNPNVTSAVAPITMDSDWTKLIFAPH